MSLLHLGVLHLHGAEIILQLGDNRARSLLLGVDRLAHLDEFSLIIFDRAGLLIQGVGYLGDLPHLGSDDGVLLLQLLVLLDNQDFELLCPLGGDLLEFRLFLFKQLVDFL